MMRSKDFARMCGIPNRELESELKKEWVKWQNTSHPDDCMSFVDYCCNIGYFKGHTVTVDFDRYGDAEILFTPR